MKLASKISLSFLITTTILTSITVSIIYVNVKKSLEDGIYSNLRSVSQSRTRHIKTFIEEDKSRIELVARTSPLASALDEIARNPRDSDKSVVELNLLLNKIMEAESEVNEIFIIGSDGKVIASTNENNIGKDRPLFLNTRNDSFVSDVNYSETSGERGYSISVPIIKESTNGFLGLLVAGFKMDGLNKITVNRTGLGRTGEVFIVNKYGYMITPSRFKDDTFLKEKAGTFCKLSYVDLGELPGNDKLTAFPNYKNTMVLGTHAFIEGLQWCVLAEIDMEEALAPLTGIQHILLGILFIVPVLAWLIGILVSRVVTISLKELQSGTEIIGSGNLDHEIGIYAEDEIGQLSRAFDKMTKDLKKTTTSINLLNKEIKERKQAEKALKKAKEDAEASNISKGQFLANISHELRTPMNSVLGFAGLLKETPMNETQNDYVQTIASSGRVLLDLINNILDLTKIETGEVEFENIAFDLKQIAESVIKIIKPRLENSELKIVFEMSEDMPVHFLGDPTCIHQILLNLLSNATKFTEQGKIKLSLSEKIIDGPLDNDISRVKIVVKDTGIGISGDKHDTIFDAFMQEDSSTTRQYGGTGLGLAIVKRLVEALKGKISVLSNKGEGSEFTVILPLRKDVGSRINT